MREKIILHSDCNNFFASVEENKNPKLRNVPMAVCGSVENRHGIVLAKNSIAKKYNIVTAETVFSAKRKCPELVIIEPHYGEYSKYSYDVNSIYREYTDIVEMFGIDESWLDVSGSTLLFGSGYEIAEKIRSRVKSEIGITVSVGVSFNKVFAKIGSDYKKPDAITEITKSNYKEILYPLSVSDMFMVGHNTAEELNRIGIYTIGDLVKVPEEIIINKLGKTGELIYSYANGRDCSAVQDTFREYCPKSVGNGKTFKHDLTEASEIRRGIMELADEVSGRLRKYRLKCKVIQVTVKNSDFKTMSKQKNIKFPVDTQRDIFCAGMEILNSLIKSTFSIRSMTITCAQLVSSISSGEQLEMFDFIEKNKKTEKNHLIDVTVDKIRVKYGRKSLISATLLE